MSRDDTRERWLEVRRAGVGWYRGKGFDAGARPIFGAAAVGAMPTAAFDTDLTDAQWD